MPSSHQGGAGGTGAKVQRVIERFARGSSDPRVFARGLGFTDHRDMADYMRSQGYTWSAEIRNYTREGSPSPVVVSKARTATPVTAGPAGGGDISDENLERFLPVLSLLENHLDQLAELLEPPAGALPRYTIFGAARTKSVYMSDGLDQLVVEFSKEKQVSQREVVEGALVEYLSRHGYEEEIAALLKGK